MDYRKLAEVFFDTVECTPKPASAKLSGLSRGEMATLKYLAAVPCAAPGEISAAQEITTARVANILAGLEKKELIGRVQDTGDRRKVIVTITEKGRREVERKRQEALDGLSRVLERMGESDASEFIRLTEKLHGILREEAAGKEHG